MQNIILLFTILSGTLTLTSSTRGLILDQKISKENFNNETKTVLSEIKTNIFHFNKKINSVEFPEKKLITNNSGVLKGSIDPFNTHIPINKLTIANIFYYTNQERIKYGLEPLVLNSKLNNSATEKINEMVQNNYFAHSSPEYPDKDFSYLIKKQNYEFLSVSENLALGSFLSEKEVVTAWMESYEHRSNILNPNWKELGVSVYQTHTGDYYAVQHFAIPKEICTEVSLRTKNLIVELETQATLLQEEIKSTEDKIKKEGEVLGIDQRTGQELIEQYNAIVDDYNKTIEEYSNLIIEYNKKVDNYKKCLASFQN